MHTSGSSGGHDTLPSRWLFLHRPSWGPLALISSSSGPGSVGSQPVSATLLHCDEVWRSLLALGLIQLCVLLPQCHQYRIYAVLKVPPKISES